MIRMTHMIRTTDVTRLRVVIAAVFGVGIVTHLQARQTQEGTGFGAFVAPPTCLSGQA